jgi:hypothetical protein
MRRARRTVHVRTVLLPVAAVALVLGACSDGSDDTGESASTAAAAPTPAATLECPAAEPELLVDRVGDAVAAVEAELGAPQRLFEIDASFAFVNVIVATAASGTGASSSLPTTTAVRYRWVPDQPLDVEEMGEAQGATFAAADLAFDPRTVLSCVRTELASSTIDLLEIVGSDGGAPVYTVFVSSEQGGQLAVQVSPAGQVQSVDPI